MTVSEERFALIYFGKIQFLPPVHAVLPQISSQWESQKNLFAFISFGKIQFLPPCRVRSHAPSIRPYRGTKVVWPDFQPGLVGSQGVTKRCRQSWLTNDALVYEPKCGGSGGVAWPQPVSTAVHRSPNKLWISNSILNLWSRDLKI